MSFRRLSSTNTTAPNRTSPPNVYISPTSSMRVTSTGLRGLDEALNGGLPLGTLTLLTEDHPTSYHRVFSQHFLSQGLSFGHALILTSFTTSSHHILTTLPSPSPSTSSPHHSSTSYNKPDLRIAWRYTPSSTPSRPTRPSNAHAVTFDLSLPPRPLPSSNALVLPINAATLSDSLLDDLTESIQACLSKKLLPRVVVAGIGLEPIADDLLAKHLCRLRAIARLTGAVVLITAVPYASQRVLSACVDAHLVINSFQGRGTKEAGLGAEWLGIVAVRKCFRDSSGIPVKGRGDVWVFKRGRRKFAFERATAAPDDEDKAKERPAESGKLGASSVCGTKVSSSGLEF